MAKEEGSSKQIGEELMEVEIADASNGCITEIRKNGLLLWPVLPQEGGEGLPYAPVNWPNPGDIWGWRVGRRVACSGYYLDRYLYLPSRFQKSTRKRDGFASKLSVEQYVRARFPGTDVNAFFSSFSWKIPSKQAYLLKDEHGSFRLSSEEVAEQSTPDLFPDAVRCKAGNRFCPSLLEDQIPLVAAQSCDICCSEPGFCRDCSCILCCKSIDLAFGGYSFIRCETTVHDNLICGHVAHLHCALRAYMAGTVGGSIGLDTEYLCRRCDSRTDLTKHVTSLLKTCESVESEDDIDKILGVGYCLLRGSHRKDSQRMFNHIESIMQKLKDGCEVKDVWKEEVGIEPAPTGQVNHVNSAHTGMGAVNCIFRNEYLKLEEEIDQVLLQLRSSLDHEYRIAQNMLHAQKDRLLSLYQEVYKEKSELDQPTPTTDRDALLSSIAAKEEQMNRELSKLRDMEKVAEDIEKTSKQVIKKHFELDLKD